MPNNEHRFFDPKSPEQPEQICGVDTEAILRLSEATTALGVLPPRINLGLYALPYAVRLVPLVEEMQSGTELTPEDVRAYRKPIKKLNPSLNDGDKLIAAAGIIGVGIPLRRALNRRIEREFPVRAAAAIDQARETIAGLESQVDFVAGFDNPQEQFVTEVNDLAQAVSTSIIEQRDQRLVTPAPVETKPEMPRGILGFFTKIALKVRNFFGRFRHRPAVNNEVTAYDAAAGIQKTIQSLAKNPLETVQRLPMLSTLLLSRLPSNMPVTNDRLALAAPEILSFLFSTSPKDDKAKNKKLLDSVKRNPHQLRFITRFKRQYGRYNLNGIQNASVELLPAIRNILPTEGAKVREIFSQIQELLKQK